MKADIKSFSLLELQAEMKQLNMPSFRAGQIYQWLCKGVHSFDEMTNLSAALRVMLNEKYYISVANVAKKQISKYDNTRKYLLELSDGQFIECVLMQYHHGFTLCLSTQVGCKMGCKFCATGKSGFLRDLTPSEMLSQIDAVQEDCGERVSNLVLMGMGEPLDNYENVLKFLELVSDEKGRNLGMRHISLSTCGIVPKMYDLADRKLQLTLSVSLHAPNDEIRSRTMPVNKIWGIDEVLKACRYYTDTTHRRISFEYALINGVNDTEACAAELASRLRGIISHVNLIPVNDVNGAGFSKSQRVHAFQASLQKKGINATVRRTLGEDIDAACGQLRRKFKAEEDIDADI